MQLDAISIVLIIFLVGACVWGIWFEYHGKKSDPKDPKNES